MDWQLAKAEFEPDGSLRDLYILDADAEVWQRVIDRLRSSGYPCRYQVDGNETPLPDKVADVFAMRDEAGFLLGVDVEGILLNCHFFTEEEVEFDLDPRDIDSEAKLEALFRFMRLIGQAAGRHVIMTPENCEELPAFDYSPETGEIGYTPVGSWC